MKRHALFVGVDKYEDYAFRSLDCAVNDAAELHGFFKDEADYDQVELLLNPKGEEEVLRVVRRLTDDLGRGDLFLFFFAGHGFRSVNGDRVLVCSGDSLEDVFSDDVLSLPKLQRNLSGVFDSALLLDTGTEQPFAARGIRPITGRDISVPAPDPDQRRFAIVESCDPGQSPVELPAWRHGLFTMALLDVLRAAREAHARLDLSFSFREELARRMEELVAMSGLRIEQRPRMSYSGTPIVLLEGAAPTPVA